MKPEEIHEGHIYTNNNQPNYFKVVQFIVDSSRPGGKTVSWHTDGFNVVTENNHRGKSHGKCGIETFAQWQMLILLMT